MTSDIKIGLVEKCRSWADGSEEWFASLLVFLCTILWIALHNFSSCLHSRCLRSLWWKVLWTVFRKSSWRPGEKLWINSWKGLRIILCFLSMSTLMFSLLLRWGQVFPIPSLKPAFSGLFVQCRLHLSQATSVNGRCGGRHIVAGVFSMPFGFSIVTAFEFRSKHSLAAAEEVQIFSLSRLRGVSLNTCWCITEWGRPDPRWARKGKNIYLVRMFLTRALSRGGNWRSGSLHLFRWHH